ncbi:MAG: hypothetical protein ABI624_22675, partial [Casimicrobiaceae bacterium]
MDQGTAQILTRSAGARPSPALDCHSIVIQFTWLCNRLAVQREILAAPGNVAVVVVGKAEDV